MYTHFNLSYIDEKTIYKLATDSIGTAAAIIFPPEQAGWRPLKSTPSEFENNIKFGFSIKNNADG